MNIISNSITYTINSYTIIIIIIIINDEHWAIFYTKTDPFLFVYDKNWWL